MAVRHRKAILRAAERDPVHRRWFIDLSFTVEIYLTVICPSHGDTPTCP